MILVTAMPGRYPLAIREFIFKIHLIKIVVVLSTMVTDQLGVKTVKQNNPSPTIK